MIIWKPKILHGGWWDVEMYEALRQKLLARYAPPSPEPAPKPMPAAKRQRKSPWKTLEEGSPALALLRFLDTWARQHGAMPSAQEIATKHFHNVTSPKTGYVSYCLSALESGGWIHREFGVSRGITITAQGRAVLEEHVEMARVS